MALPASDRDSVTAYHEDQSDASIAAPIGHFSAKPGGCGGGGPRRLRLPGGGAGGGILSHMSLTLIKFLPTSAPEIANGGVVFTIAIVSIVYAVIAVIWFVNSLLESDARDPKPSLLTCFVTALLWPVMLLCVAGYVMLFHNSGTEAKTPA